MVAQPLSAETSILFIPILFLVITILLNDLTSPNTYIRCSPRSSKIPIITIFVLILLLPLTKIIHILPSSYFNFVLLILLLQAALTDSSSSSSTSPSSRSSCSSSRMHSQSLSSEQKAEASPFPHRQSSFLPVIDRLAILLPIPIAITIIISS